MDYNFTTVSIPFFANQTHTINVSIIDDYVAEGNETFSCVLTIDSPHPNMILENSTMEIVILDNGEHIHHALIHIGA